jgi:hypothetical protein
MPAKSAQSERTHVTQSREGEREFVFHPQNDDLFVRTGRQVIEHCRLGIGVEAWLGELHDLLGAVAMWCSERANKIRSCHVAPLASRVTLFFVPSSTSYDFDLGAELAELSVSLIQHYNVGMVETRQIPWSEQDRFIRVDTSRLIYGEPQPAH